MLAGCASIASGTSQEILVSTEPAGAECIITRNGEEIGRINPTPGTITVEKSRHDLKISCSKQDYYRAEALDKSGTEPWTYGNIAIGIAFFGGFIGHGIDRVTGASNHYDEEVTVTLVPAPSLTPSAPLQTASPPPPSVTSSSLPEPLTSPPPGAVPPAVP